MKGARPRRVFARVNRLGLHVFFLVNFSNLREACPIGFLGRGMGGRPSYSLPSRCVFLAVSL